VCLPHAGGSASFFHPLSALLAPGAETVSVQYPGRQDRRGEPPAATVEELADGVADSLVEQGDGGPTVLFGHSMGALVAFETARRLERRGRPPAAIVLSGRRAPSRQLPETVHLRDDAGVLAELRGLSGTDSRLLGDEEVLRLILPSVRADYRALAAYRGDTARPVGSPIVVMVGDADPLTPVEDALAWSAYTTGGFGSEVFPGDHFYLAAQRDRVTRSLRAVLAAAR
jgi:surfactin synthase thioesterase subunit